MNAEDHKITLRGGLQQPMIHSADLDVLYDRDWHERIMYEGEHIFRFLRASQ